MKGSLKAVVVPEENTSLLTLLNQILSGTAVTLLQVNKQNIQIKLQTLITEKNITTAWMMTFAYIIPYSVLKILPGNFLNFHYGILPKYRGPNPILAQMLHGESE
ncbi:MAG: formyltransferase family protein, partial [Saprospiraceae bacterium]